MHGQGQWKWYKMVEVNGAYKKWQVWQTLVENVHAVSNVIVFCHVRWLAGCLDKEDILQWSIYDIHMDQKHILSNHLSLVLFFEYQLYTHTHKISMNFNKPTSHRSMHFIQNLKENESRSICFLIQLWLQMKVKVIQFCVIAYSLLVSISIQKYPKKNPTPPPPKKKTLYEWNELI